MQDFIIILIALLLLEAGEIVWLGAKLRKQSAKRRAKEAWEAYPWDWTKEQEQQVEAAMELICDKCHEPYCRSEQEELDETCAVCQIQDALYRLARGKEAQG